jgi:AI-2 transport protein TqsA
MMEPPQPTPSDDEDSPTLPRSKWRNAATIAAVATITQVILAAAAAWYLLNQLAPLLQPLLVAVFLAYLLMPYHARLSRHIGRPASLIVLASLSGTVLLILALAIYASILGLSDELPTLQERVNELNRQADQFLAQTTPWWRGADGQPASLKLGAEMTQLTKPLLNLAVDTVIEACAVALYLLFLLLEGSRFPDRVRQAYSPARAAEILDIAEQISTTVFNYLKAKTKASLILAVPVGLILWAVGVRFALLWAVLTFLCNFIPYIGSVVAYLLPASFAFVWYGPQWEAVVASLLLLGCHLTSAILIEPFILSNAMGLSPLVILASLAFWGLLWGLPGMFLAIPLTVVTVIVLDHFQSTRPAARLLSGR